MKIISGLFKFIAVLLMVVFTITLPFALLIQGFGSLLLSPGKMVEMLEEHIIDPEIISSIAEYQVSQLEYEATSENAVIQIAVDGLKNMDDEEWLLLTNLVAPPELISQSIDDGLEGYYRWLDGSSPVPGIQIDLKPWNVCAPRMHRCAAVSIPLRNSIGGGNHQLPAAGPNLCAVHRAGGDLCAFAAGKHAK